MKHLILVWINLIITSQTILAEEVQRFEFKRIFPGDLPSGASPCWQGRRNGFSCSTTPQPNDFRPTWILKTLSYSSRNPITLLGDLVLSAYYPAVSGARSYGGIYGASKSHVAIKIPSSEEGGGYSSVHGELTGLLYFPINEEKPIFRGVLSGSFPHHADLEFEILRKNGEKVQYEIKKLSRDSFFDVSSKLAPGDRVSFRHIGSDRGGGPVLIYDIHAYIETNGVKSLDSFPLLPNKSSISSGGIDFQVTKSTLRTHFTVGGKTYEINAGEPSYDDATPSKCKYKISNDDNYKYACKASIENTWERTETFPVKTIIEIESNQYCKDLGGYISLKRHRDGKIFSISLSPKETKTINHYEENLGAFTASIEDLGVQDIKCSIMLNIQNDIPDAKAYLSNINEQKITENLEDLLLFKANFISSFSHKNELACLIKRTSEDSFFDEDFILILMNHYRSVFGKKYDPKECKAHNSSLIDSENYCLDVGDCLECSNYLSYKRKLTQFENLIFELELLLSHTNYITRTDIARIQNLKSMIIERSDMRSDLGSNFSNEIKGRLIDHLFLRTKQRLPKENERTKYISKLKSSSFLKVWEDLKK